MSSSKKYKVVSLSVSGNGKKVFRNGDIVTESDFPKGVLSELLKKDKSGHSHLVPVASTTKKVTESTKKQAETKKEDKKD